MEEYKVLKPRNPSLDENDWPQFTLYEASVQGTLKQNSHFKSLLNTDLGERVVVRGKLKVSSKTKRYFLSGQYKEHDLVLTDVGRYAQEEYENGDLVLWAAGQAGWFRIHPALSFKANYDRDLEAIRLLNAIRDFEETKKGGGDLIQRLFTSCTEDPLVRCKSEQDVMVLFGKHRLFLIAHAIRMFYEMTQRQKSMRSYYKKNEWYLTKYFRERNPEDLERIHEKIKSSFPEPHYLIVDRPVIQDETNPSPSVKVPGKLTAIRNSQHPSPPKVDAEDRSSPSVSMSSSSGSDKITPRIAPHTGLKIKLPAAIPNHIPTGPIESAESDDSNSDSPVDPKHRFDIFRSQGSVDTIILEFERIARTFIANKINPTEVSLEKYIAQVKTIEHRRSLTSSPQIIVLTIRNNRKLLAQGLALDSDIGKYTWKDTLMYRELIDTPDSSDDDAEDENEIPATGSYDVINETEEGGPAKKRRIDNANFTQQSPDYRSQGQLRLRTDQYGAKGPASASSTRGSKSIRGRGSRQGSVSSGVSTPQSPNGNRRPGRPRGSRGTRGGRRSTVRRMREDLSRSFDADMSSSDDESASRMRAPGVDHLNNTTRRTPSFDSDMEDESEPDYSHYVLATEELPNYMAQRSDDLWTCPMNGCLHRVRNASSEKSTTAIQEHYDAHARQQEKDNRAMGIVVAEARTSLPVSNLLDKIRGMTAEDS